jgi:2-polyprenyl-3-methyl-5-hydroxy-6-metoxy-1,4-benzoquinol methylase
MIKDFISFFEYNGVPASLTDDHLVFDSHRVPIRNGIARFTPDRSYGTGNFSRLRECHPKLQLDSYNMTTDRCDTLLERTKWPQSFFKDKTVLECGCGVGPDTEILLSLGARVLAADLTNLDTASNNLGQSTNLCFVQADIADLPLKQKSFDIVFCHRVLQHTPDPGYTLRHILQFVKPDGAVFVHSYAKTFFQMCTWKYALRPITTRMDSKKLYHLIETYAPSAYAITNKIATLPKGHMINHFLFPFHNHSNHDKLKKLSDNQLIEYGIHDTFDSLSPRYDKPLSAKTINRIAQQMISVPFEVIEQRTITLLRTIVKNT